jgi:hypothetical protein
MWPFSETNAAAMRTLKTQGIYPESSGQRGEEMLAHVHYEKIEIGEGPEPPTRDRLLH